MRAHSALLLGPLMLALLLPAAALADAGGTGPDPGEVFGFDLTPDDCDEAPRANQALGGLIGGIVGGLIGSGVGKGSGKTAATIGGAVAGAFGGAMLGGKVAEGDPRCLPDGYHGPAGPVRRFEPTQAGWLSAGLR